MARARLTIPDMTCGHCQAHVTGALEALEGVTSVQVDLETKAVDVEFHGITLERIQEVLAEEDYPVAAASPL